MFIKKLSIAKSNGNVDNIKIIEIIREVLFKDGLNVITDDGKKEGNSVGKSTFLYLIDLCFGAKNIEKIYENEKTKSEENLIKSFINENNIIIILDIINHTIIRPLFKNNMIYLDGEKLNLKEYNKKMSKIIFNNDKDVPSFRQLINKFIRIDDNQVKNMLDYFHSNTNKVDQQLIKRFLFSDTIFKMLYDKSQKEKEFDNFKKDNKAFKSYNIKEIKRDIDNYKYKISELEDKKNNIRNTYNVNKSIINNSELTAKLNVKHNELANKNYIIQTIENNINSLSNRKRDDDSILLYKLYNNVLEYGFIKDINITYEKLLKFHNTGIDNNIKYMKDYLEILQDEKNKIVIELNYLTEQYYNNDLFENIDKIITELSNLYNEIGKKEKELEQVENYTNKIKQYKNEISNYKCNDEIKKEFQDDINRFNSNFNEIYFKMFNKRNSPSLYLEDDFSINIKTEKERSGSGENIGEVIAFDLAYFQYINEKKMKFPLFQVHDKLETLDVNAKDIAFNEILPETNCQYIIAALYSSMDNKFDDNIILKLSQQDKLFKID